MNHYFWDEIFGSTPATHIASSILALSNTRSIHEKFILTQANVWTYTWILVWIHYGNCYLLHDVLNSSFVLDSGS